MTKLRIFFFFSIELKHAELIEKYIYIFTIMIILKQKFNKILHFFKMIRSVPKIRDVHEGDKRYNCSCSQAEKCPATARDQLRIKYISIQGIQRAHFICTPDLTLFGTPLLTLYIILAEFETVKNK